MAVVSIALIALFLMVPEARALIEPLMDRAGQAIDANIPLFLTALLLAIGATVVSWLITRWPRRKAPEPYRVIRRFRMW
jgi:hypothetical protein